MIHTAGASARPVRRWDSWYDAELVTRAGEDILEAYDAWAVREFRRHHLVWSSWGDEAVVPPPHNVFHPSIGFRTFDDIDPTMARLFFASLLWRAASTKLVEFASISLPRDDLDQLAASLVSGRPLGDDFYPVTLTQFSTKGDVHLAGPQARIKTVYDDDGLPVGETPVFRIYFDGLAAHFHPPPLHARLAAFGPAGVGNEGHLVVQTIPFEQAAQKREMALNVAAARLAWPKEAAKLWTLPRS
jgi:hypothetical protein